MLNTLTDVLTDPRVMGVCAIIALAAVAVANALIGVGKLRAWRRRRVSVAGLAPGELTPLSSLVLPYVSDGRGAEIDLTRYRSRGPIYTWPRRGRDRFTR